MKTELNEQIALAPTVTAKSDEGRPSNEYPISIYPVPKASASSNACLLSGLREKTMIAINKLGERENQDAHQLSGDGAERRRAGAQCELPQLPIASDR